MAEGKQPFVSRKELPLQSISREVQQTAAEEADYDGSPQVPMRKQLCHQPARNQVRNGRMQWHHKIVRAGNQDIERPRQQVRDQDAGQKHEAQRDSLP